ncbi:MAG TPA: hypothetical protein PLD73_16225 [Candidatus Hydrogenedentes bacterium]|nr:hypothetical protein [Candidatus Hydrogenedentota bacterium]
MCIRCAGIMLVAALAAWGARSAAAQEMPQFRVREAGEGRVVEVLSGDRVLLASPPEGLWSVAMDWRDGWPTEWQHAHPGEPELCGEWTLLRGLVETPQGNWRVSDAYRPEGRAIKCVRRYVWEGAEAAGRVTLSVRFQTPGTGIGAVLPGILYHGNPSGARSGRTPIYTGAPGEEAFYEEHRFPMPFASLEWQEGGAFHGAALHALPSPVPFGNLPDQWWSMGLRALDTGTELALLSGPCASNGERSVVKANQPGFLPYNDASLNVPPGSIIEKTFWLEAYPVPEEGAGFQRPVWTSLSLFDPYCTEGLPTFEEIVRAKYRFSDTRWHETRDAAGYTKYPDKPILVMGWCGQAAALGFANQVLGPRLGAPEALERAQKSLDFLTNAVFYEGGFHTWYHCNSNTWDHHEPLSQGQAMLSFANAILAAPKSGLDDSAWRIFLGKACDFHARRILKEDWNPTSTDEGFFIAPLCAAHQIFGQDEYLLAATKAAEVYAARSLSMREPYWGGTLDASCEDKEGAFAAFQGFLALHEVTKEPQYLKWARHACDVALTYVVVWDIDLPPGRLRDHAFKTRGWTAVSVQNMHIDVYGVLIAPYVYKLGLITGSDELKRLALVMYRSCGQLIDPYGSQGEQPQQTNYAQRGKYDTPFGLRGGYVEDWTVFWITAHFLNAAAQFKLMDAETGL